MSLPIFARMGPMLTRPYFLPLENGKGKLTSNSPADVKPGKRERDYRFLDAEELVKRLIRAGTRKPVRGPDGWSLGAAVRCSNRFHLRCKSRCRSRGYWREFGTGNLPFGMIQKPCQRRIVPPALLDVVHTSLYLSAAVHEASRMAAFHERGNIHDIIMQGIDLALKKRGYASIDYLKAGKKR
jgi:hypothetical protein